MFDSIASRKPPAPPDITVSIVSHNTRELLRACLESLRARQDEGEVSLQIIVVDNGSSDGSVGMVKAEYPEVEVLIAGDNLGYGRANNLAFERARGRYFLALNSDTEVTPGALRALRDFMDTHPQAGAAGPQLVWPDGRPQTSHGPDPRLSGIIREQIGLDKLMSRFWPGREPQIDNVQGDEPREVDQICGACQLVRREAYHQVGGYDPAYFMYQEDVDLNMRLRRAGWRIFFVPRARVRHHLGASSRQDWRTRARMVAALNWSRHYYFHRYEGAGRAQLLKSLFLLGAALRLAGWSFLALARPAARDKVKLFRAVLRQTWRIGRENRSTEQ